MSANKQMFATQSFVQRPANVSNLNASHRVKHFTGLSDGLSGR